MASRSPRGKILGAKARSDGDTGGGEVRIVGGAWRGRKIAVPDGVLVRPTGERAREAIFNRLTHGFSDIGFRLPGAHVVDLFAGTGAFGFEALSRGAATAAFVEASPAVVAGLKATVGKLGAEDRTTITLCDACALTRGNANATLVFLDPPYGENLLAHALASLRQRHWLAANALVIAECDAGDERPALDGYRLIDTRDYGRASFLFLAAE
ncbi:MAG: 16S rRNA (guanine(966)-N(2))-methyltransferase RsmD [Rhodobacteraceae bacterium]|nr:16S rRNA (guanine(966)-N(2))-methyltransferase RsmD [Paracoccaceae bacterium]